MFIPDAKSRQSLAKRLNLDYDGNSQDWKYEVSNSERLNEFIEEYDKPSLTIKEKETLMEIILDNANDLLLEKRAGEFNKYINLIEIRLLKNINLHCNTIAYWSQNNFEISSKLRTDK